MLLETCLSHRNVISREAAGLLFAISASSRSIPLGSMEYAQPRSGGYEEELIELLEGIRAELRRSNGQAESQLRAEAFADLLKHLAGIHIPEATLIH